MSRISRDRALFLGLCALQDYVDQARRNPLRGTIHLRALLAMLALHGKGDVKAYEQFWRYCRIYGDEHNATTQIMRSTYTQMQWTGIAADLGFPSVKNEFCQTVGEVVKQARQPRLDKPKRDCGFL